MLFLHPVLQHVLTVKGQDKFIDFNSYLSFTDGRAALAGAEDVLRFRFRFCNLKGILLYLEGSNGFFALGVNDKRLYLEWKTNHKLVEVRDRMQLNILLSE